MNNGKPKPGPRGPISGKTATARADAGSAGPPIPEAAAKAAPIPPPRAALPLPIPTTDVTPEVIAAPPAEVAAPAPQPATAPRQAPADSPDDPWDAVLRAQNVWARGIEEMTLAITGLTRSRIAATADAAVALLGARTLAEAVEINAGLARRNANAMVEGAAKLSEIGIKAAGDAALPLLSHLGGRWPVAEIG